MPLGFLGSPRTRMGEPLSASRSCWSLQLRCIAPSFAVCQTFGLPPLASSYRACTTDPRSLAQARVRQGSMHRSDSRLDASITVPRPDRSQHTGTTNHPSLMTEWLCNEQGSRARDRDITALRCGAGAPRRSQRQNTCTQEAAREGGKLKL